MVEKVIIIGSGPAGLSAALYTAREDFKPLVIGGTELGGELMLTSMVENYPAFPNGINGPELIGLMKRQAEKFGATFIYDNVDDIDLSSKPYKVRTASKTFETSSIIIATGASAKWLDLPSEKRFLGRGVSSCATCDAPFFKNRNVIVVGGGDSAMEDSLFLAKFANSVTIVHRRDSFKASRIMQERVLSNRKIKVIWNSVVDEISGNARVTGIKIRDVNTGEVKSMEVEGVFVAIGYKPNTGFLRGKLDLDRAGYIITRNEVRTGVKGVFAAGDAVDRVYRQAVTAAASGTKAALEVRAYMLEMAHSSK
ncbi:MAG: thioredoxin-disulfide reductase [Thermoplasmataceae archaeon]